MAKFSKQHYQAIAAILYDQRNHIVGMQNLHAGNGQSIYWNGAKETVESIAVHLSSLFTDDNVRFNPNHFLAVVRGDRQVNSRPPRS